MKTPDEIKKGLECCRTDDCGRSKLCSYWTQCGCMNFLHDDALAYIQQLEAANAELLTKCERLERERDELLKDISSVQGCICIICKKYINPNPGTGTAECKILGRFKDRGCDGALMCGQFEWRGVKEE